VHCCLVSQIGVSGNCAAHHLNVSACNRGSLGLSEQRAQTLDRLGKPVCCCPAHSDTFMTKNYRTQLTTSLLHFPHPVL
jgi:hypothetical protein